jgi:hypothetical protein
MEPGIYAVLPSTISCHSPIYGKELRRINRPSSKLLTVKVGCATSDLGRRCASYGRRSEILFQEELLRDEFAKYDILYIEGFMISRLERAGFKVWRTKNNPNRKEYFRIKRSDLDTFIRIAKNAVEAASTKLLS